MASVARWSGREKFKRRLLALPDLVKQEIRDELRRGAEEIVAAQKSAAPVSTSGNHGNPPGALRDSIRWQWADAKRIAYSQGSSKSVASNGYTVRITAGNGRVRYAHLVEFGTAPHAQGGMFAGTQHPGTPPRPFFYPVYRAKKRRVRRRVANAVRKSIRKSRGA